MTKPTEKNRGATISKNRYIVEDMKIKIWKSEVDPGSQGFFLGGLGVPHPAKILSIPHPTPVPVFVPRLVPPQPRFVPENLKNLNTFLCQIWLLLRGYCTPGPYFGRLCAFSQKIKQLRTKYSMDLVRNVPRNSKNTVLLQLRPLLWSYSAKCELINILYVLSHKSITTWVSEILVQ